MLNLVQFTRFRSDVIYFFKIFPFLPFIIKRLDCDSSLFKQPNLSPDSYENSENSSLNKDSEYASSLHHIGDTIENALEVSFVTSIYTMYSFKPVNNKYC